MVPDVLQQGVESGAEYVAAAVCACLRTLQGAAGDRLCALRDAFGKPASGDACVQ